MTGRYLRAMLLSCVILVSAAPHAHTQESLWAGNFGPTGVSGTVKAIGQWGDSLVIGGEIIGLPYSYITAKEFAIFDLVDRSWHTTQWGPAGTDAEVRAIAAGPDGSVVLGGNFSFYRNGMTMANLAVLSKNGEWSTLSGDSIDGFNGTIHALLWHEGKLYIGGELTWVGFPNMPFGFAVWDPDNGFDVPFGIESGLFSIDPIIYDFAVSSAHGNHVYLGGDFTFEGFLESSNCLARFNVTTGEVEALPVYPYGPVYAIHTEDNVDWADRIAVGGEFSDVVVPDVFPPPQASNIAILNFVDSTVQTPAIGTNGPVYDLKTYHFNEDRLLVAGAFDSANGMKTGPLAQWNIPSDFWSQFSPDLTDPEDTVHVISDYIGTRYTIGGSFEHLGDSSLVNNIIQISPLSPTQWFPLGDGLVREGASFVSGARCVAANGYKEFYVGGNFTVAGGQQVGHVAKWDTDQWYPLGDGVNTSVAEIAARNDTVYVAGGSITSASGVPANGIAMWDGSQWHALGDGLRDGYIQDMVIDSAGHLYVCGYGIDTIGTAVAAGIAKWDGSAWEAVGDIGWSGNFPGFVWDMYLDPETHDLYVCGDFESADGVPCNGVARWNGSSWLALGDEDIGDGHPYVIERAPNGRIVVAGFMARPEIRQMITPGVWEAYGGGVAVPDVSDALTVECDFFLTGEPLQFVGEDGSAIPVENIARFDGSEWIDVAGGQNVSGDVYALDSYGSQLAIAGAFRIAAGKPANGFTIWNGIRDASDSIGTFVTPNAGDTMYAGEIYTVNWREQATSAPEVNLEISYDSGITWQTIASNIDGQLGQIPWLVPEGTPSDNCFMRISDTYAPCAFVRSWRFTIIDDPSVEVTWLQRWNGPFYMEPFTIDYHNWNFRNTGSNLWNDSLAARITYPSNFPAPPDSVENFPDWFNFVAAFGNDYCFQNNNFNSIKPRALERWKDILRKWGGSCLGFSKSALLWWERNEFNTNSYIPDAYLDDFELDGFSRNMVNRHWIYQNGAKHIEYNREVSDYSVMQTLSLIREDMPFDDPRSLSFSYRSWKDKKTDTAGTVTDSVWRRVGHNLVPYAIKEFQDSIGIYHIYVYDSNRPSSSERYIRVDSVNGTWGYPASGIPDTLSRFVPRLPISEYMGLATDDRKTKSPQQLPPANLLFASSTEDILITDSLGNQIGWANNNPINTMTDADFIYPDDPDYAYDYPMGYVVPDGPVAVELSNFEAPATRLSFSTDSATHVYQRLDADSTHTDRLHVGSGMDIVNPDTTPKMISLTSIMAEQSTEYFIRLDSVAFSPNDSAHIAFDSAGVLAIENYGQAKDYSFILWYSGVDTTMFLQSMLKVPLPANANHKLAPNWDNILVTGDIKILADNDQDGTYEDTMTANIATDVPDEQGSTLPDTYHLGQNFPNPFNPTTTIAYSLPERSEVRIEVFNVLGRRVSVLIDTEQSAGSYEVVWDATNQSGSPVASGVYFYRITANGYTESRKMLLLR